MVAAAAPLILVILALSLDEGEAVRCYMCSSKQDVNCKDPFQAAQQEHKLTHCSQDAMRNVGDLLPGVFSNYGYQSSQPEDFVCVKAVTREHDREVVVRSCSIPRADNFDVCSQLKSRDLTYCQTCAGDACNGARHLAPASALLALPLALLLALRAK